MTRISAVVLAFFALGCAGPDTPKPSEKPAGVDAASPCEGAPTCGVEGPQCPEGTDCFSLAACEKPVCMAATDACEFVCGRPECALMESHPMQIGC